MLLSVWLLPSVWCFDPMSLPFNYSLMQIFAFSSNVYVLIVEVVVAFYSLFFTIFIHVGPFFNSILWSHFAHRIICLRHFEHFHICVLSFFYSNTTHKFTCMCADFAHIHNSQIKREKKKTAHIMELLL